jgi:UDP-N-acetylmuramoyl-tripeptide--D-alanyl-D-alanine ligase
VSDRVADRGIGLELAASLMSGRVERGNDTSPDNAASGAAIDTRALKAGELFFALRAARDGHEFVGAAADAGAAGVVVETARMTEVIERLRGRDLAVIGVTDVRKALADLARGWRQAQSARVVAITGSNGKTTTKEMVASILRAAHGSQAVLATQGNLNNDLGVPMTLLGLRPQHRSAVIEMGMSALGEIATLAAIALPDVGLVTNVGASHLEKLGSLEAVAQAKGELYEWIGRSEHGIGVVPQGDPRLMFRAEVVPPARRVTVAFDPRTPADVVVLDSTPQGADGTDVRLRIRAQPVEVRLSFVGAHNVRNAATAAGVALALGLDVDTLRTGLANARPARHRSELVRVAGRTVLADCYNSAPASALAALDALSSLAPAGRRVAVLGDMLELGPDTDKLHLELGARAASADLALLVCVGALAPHIAQGARSAGMAGDRIVTTLDRVQAAHLALARSQAGDAVLIKASRGVKLEAVLEAMRAEAGETAPVGEGSH